MTAALTRDNIAAWGTLAGVRTTATSEIEITDVNLAERAIAGGHIESALRTDIVAALALHNRVERILSEHDSDGELEKKIWDGVFYAINMAVGSFTGFSVLLAMPGLFLGGLFVRQTFKEMNDVRVATWQKLDSEK